ncbi:hypothetical protein [Nocardiopsis sp. Huas11]|uniref:hypothetical protein n=1 Tax=Nocardiopsis sp. Huas11 TaxID=2183912 RepID=UPI0011C3923F|nr:hypothetical protein [Nocardiopsis sp. Huas11]
MALCCAVMAAAPNAYVAALAWALLAGALTLSNTAVVGILQLVIPTEVMGRVLSNTRMLTLGLSPVGAIIGGLLARSDLRLPSVAAAVVMVIATLWVVRPLASLCRRADRIERERAGGGSGADVV